MTARVIRVDWSAFAAANAQSRRACGPKAFILGGTRVEEPAPIVDAWADSVDAWRTKNMGRNGVTC